MVRLITFLVAFAAASAADVGAWLDIHFEENHAGAFYHLASTLPLDRPHTLVLIDAHSDSNGIPDSDRMRAAIRNVPDAKARDLQLERWRSAGAVQCFDWIEPLMPAPVADVLWVASPALDPLDIARRQTLARELLDGHIEAFPRECGALAERFRATDFNRFQRELSSWPRDRSVVVSLDLDYFAEVPDGALAAEFEKVFSAILRVPGLCALTISRSTPFLRDAAQANALTVLALDAVTGIANARVTFAPFAATGPDRSRRARDLAAKGLSLPALDIQDASPELRSILLTRTGPGLARFTVEPHEKAEALIESWRQAPFNPGCVVVDRTPEPDGWHHLPAGGDDMLRVSHAEGGAVRWFALVPEAASTNVAGVSLGFAEDAPRWLRRVPKSIGRGETISVKALQPFLELQTHAGAALVFAEVDRDGERWRTNILRIAFRAGTGFHAALSEQFARPYAFGCGVLGPDGPADLIAADCANFLIAALRRDGWQIPWGNPKQFAAHLEPIGVFDNPGAGVSLPFCGEDFREGLFIHFGSHVAALWDDRPPVGKLNADDIIAHHLEGMPELVTLGTLMRGRESFRLMRRKTEPTTTRIVIGGDVMLGRRVAEGIAAGRDPFTGIRGVLEKADVAIVNLECVASPLGDPMPGRTIHFRAHPRAAELLVAAGIDVVSVANNHSGDFGPEAERDAADRLRKAGLRCAGSEPVRIQSGGRTITIFACNSEPDASLLDQIRSERGSTIIVLPHWGTEHHAIPDSEQMALAEKLAAAGAHIIAGSGPHTRQPLVFSNGTLVAYSLGNLIFDGPGPGSGWSHGALLEIVLAPDGRIIRARELSVRIADDGAASME